MHWTTTRKENLAPPKKFFSKDRLRRTFLNLTSQKTLAECSRQAGKRIGKIRRPNLGLATLAKTKS